MPPPPPSKNRPKKMAAECGGLYFMFLAPPPLSEVSGSATELGTENAYVVLFNEILATIASK